MLEDLSKEQLITRCRNLELIVYHLQGRDPDMYNYCPKCADAVNIDTVRTCKVCNTVVVKF